MLKTNFEKFCEGVAATTVDAPVDSLKTENRGIDIVAILALIETIATIIKSVSDMCPNKSKFAQIAKNPSFTQRILFRSEFRKTFNEHDNWQVRRLGLKAASHALNSAANMTETELQQIVDELELIDNNVI